MLKNSRRYIQCGAEYRINPSSDPYQNYVATGLNTGNLYIGYAVNNLFNTKKSFSIWNSLSESDVEEIRASSDIIVMGASNFINQSTNFQIPAENLQKLKLPIIVLGIGAQAPSDSVKEINLTSGTRNFLHQISEHSVSIGVRGEYTAELLNNMGIKNTTIIGCPTYYLNRDINFTVKMSSIKNIEDLRPLLNYTDVKQKCDEKIFKYAFNNKIDVVGQTEYVEEYWMRGMDINADNLLVSSKESVKENQYKKIIGTSVETIKDYFKKHFYQFYDIDQWTEQIKEYNFLFGTRFHGNMIAVQNGIPALLVAHDSRTKELAEYCNIPFVEARNLLGDIDLVKLYSETNYSKFNFEYSRKFRNYVDFLKTNNVTDVDLLLNNELESLDQAINEELEIIDLTSCKTVSVMSSRIAELFHTHQLLYRCPLENIAKLKNGPSVEQYVIENDELHIEVVGKDPHVVLPNFINFDKDKLYLKIVLTTSVDTVLEVFYEEANTSTDYPYSEQCKVSHKLKQGKNELYLAIEGNSHINSLRLDIGSEIGKYVLHELIIRA
ncbi:polysaccharide pyruvyl transferase family protein [Ammoniphilus sp. CFH 90114]|uniref:polysaccharide pyruvyl transferase family protein n=1 Tax=Ammoniphilus sp. CFH 90114 TaxID=2493665 RepID=UPI0013E90DD8|nr:polysaccharide pyruvyl transferase family protein [Ammoniphilus sp. CFH 90114]